MQKPTEPNTLALTARPDPIQSVVPVSGSDQGQAVAADGKTAVEGAGAVFEQRALLV